MTYASGIFRPLLAEEALEVAGDRVGGGEVLAEWWRVVRLVHRLLELLDERLHVRVARHGGVHLALVVLAGLLQRAAVHGDAGDPLEAADERQRRLGIG